MKTPLIVMTLAVLATGQLHSANSTDAAANAINALGIDLLVKTGRQDVNALLSPYSIQEALAMTYAGADGKTRDEMAAVLHFPKNDAGLSSSFSALRQELSDIEKSTGQAVGDSRRGGPKEPVAILVANRLYGQKGYDFRSQFLDLLKMDYGAPLEQFDFLNASDKAAKLINTWVSDQTHSLIRDLIPEGALTKETRLVLVNAIYLKAAWAVEFQKGATEPAPFHVNGGEAHNVLTMNQMSHYGYAKKDGYTAVTLPYIGGQLQFLVLLPDDPKSVTALQAQLTPELLAGCANLESTRVNLWLPRFKMEPPVMKLGEQLKALGMKTAFDDPKGSADFDGIAPRKPGDYLYISEVFHKTFLSLDENGTEAAAATAVAMMAGSAMRVEAPPVEVHVDHPFLFAIQDRASGACLFLGRVNDPR